MARFASHAGEPWSAVVATGRLEPTPDGEVRQLGAEPAEHEHGLHQGFTGRLVHNGVDPIRMLSHLTMMIQEYGPAWFGQEVMQHDWCSLYSDGALDPWGQQPIVPRGCCLCCEGKSQELHAAEHSIMARYGEITDSAPVEPLGYNEAGECRDRRGVQADGVGAVDGGALGFD